MKLPSVWIAATLIAIPSISYGSGTPPPGKAAPAIVPYLCSDGHTANVIYESGSNFRLARAVVSHEGRDFEMRAAPTLYGVRYRTAAAVEGDSALAWSLRGEQAVLSEAPEADSYTRPERELLRCVRMRGAAAPVAAAVAEEHDEGHDEAH